MGRFLVGLLACALLAPGAPAQDAPPEKPAVEKESPWLLAPVFSVNPKLGVSAGALAGYLHYFDGKSPVSLFGTSAQYTSTGSVVAGAFGKVYFDEDRQRITAAAIAGNIKNDYHDFLGTGKPLESEDRIRGTLGRYLHRVAGDWFAGVQGIYTNYTTFGQSPSDVETLNTLGLTGFTSAGLGLAVYRDSRDSEFRPSSGWLLNLNNVAYRDWLAGDFDFDVYRSDLRWFLPQAGGSVLAVRQMNQWTVDAPPSALAPVQLRGYKLGQYLGENMSSLEVEERLSLGARFTASAFAGLACLYGDGTGGAGRENLYPAGGFGIQYVLKPKAGIVLDLEYAAGKNGNYGIYLKLGYSF